MSALRRFFLTSREGNPTTRPTRPSPRGQRKDTGMKLIKRQPKTVKTNFAVMYGGKTAN
jgi:hypothetical protein